MIIKRRVSFEFLGEEYAKGYGIFKPIPLSEYPEISKTVDAEQDGVKKGQLMLERVKKQFVKGEFPDEDGNLQAIEAKDLDDLDGDSLTRLYNNLMGPDPKALPPSPSSSETADTPPSNT